MYNIGSGGLSTFKKRVCGWGRGVCRYTKMGVGCFVLQSKNRNFCAGAYTEKDFFEVIIYKAVQWDKSRI